MNFQPDESQLNCLKTWYPIDNPLHLDPRHAVIKLAGEAGEILDLYGKHEYKPNFDWMNCKHCGKGKHESFCHHYAPMLFYTPLILDELGDYSYYLRILAYQKGVSFEELCEGYRNDWIDEAKEEKDFTLALLNELLRDSQLMLEKYLFDNLISIVDLRDCAYDLLAILSKLDTTLNQVLELNYKKLNSEPTNHGWKNAKMKTIADCPPMNPPIHKS